MRFYRLPFIRVFHFETLRHADQRPPVSSLKDSNIIVPPTQLASLTFAASLNEEYF